jgi:cytochrome c biogenesis protein CcdA
VAGFAAVFIAYGALFGALSIWLIQWQDVVTRVLGIVVIVMGLVFIGQVSFLQRSPPSGGPSRVSPAPRFSGLSSGSGGPRASGRPSPRSLP